MPRTIVVLIVDDDPDDVELTREMLRRAKAAVDIHSVDNGAKALSFLRREGPYGAAPVPDLILLDLHMPVMDGRETLTMLKGDERFKTIPVVVLTTSTADEEVAGCYSRGANCYVTKPVGLEEFSRAVRSIEDFWLKVARLPPR